VGAEEQRTRMNVVTIALFKRAECRETKMNAKKALFECAECQRTRMNVTRALALPTVGVVVVARDRHEQPQDVDDRWAEEH
jgi:hypothetical protein